MPSVLAAGTVAYDSVKTPFGNVDEVLGGSATYFSVSASYFTQVCLVACVGTDFRDQDVAVLKKHSIDLEGLELVEGGKTFRWKGEYGYDLNEAHTLDTQLNVIADFQPKVPQKYQDLEYVFLGNIEPSLQRQVVSQVRKPKLIACDTMNYWIDGYFESLLETLKRVHVLIINDAEARQLSREANLVKAAHKILGWGPSVLVVKRGEYGVLMFQRDEQDGFSVFGAPAYPLEDVFDPTGAGDSFAGGFMGYLAGTGRADAESMRQAIIFGSVMASFNVEKFSLDRLKELTFTEIKLRYQEFKQMMRFEDAPAFA
ncbi:MAG: PfkB family carbohydrate kinase [Acidobacteriota bacterium]